MLTVAAPPNTSTHAALPIITLAIRNSGGRGVAISARHKKVKWGTRRDPAYHLLQGPVLSKA